MGGLTARTARALATTLVLGAVCHGCARETATAPTLDDLGATALAGLGGDGLRERCTTLPAVPRASMVSCSGASRAEVRRDLAAGEYVVVLLCDGTGRYRAEAVEPSDGFDPFEVRCSGDDPTVGAPFTVRDGGVRAWREVLDDGEYFAVLLMRAPAAT